MVRLVILYPGDIQQDFLVYQQAAFFFFFFTLTQLSRFMVFILLEDPHTDSLQIKRLTNQKTLLS